MKKQVEERLKFLETGESQSKNEDIMNEVLQELKEENLYVQNEKKVKKKKEKKSKKSKNVVEEETPLIEKKPGKKRKGKEIVEEEENGEDVVVKPKKKIKTK